MNWIDAKRETPPCEGRYFIVYRHNGKSGIERPYIGDFYENRWSGLPRDCEVIYWAEVPDWPSHTEGGE